MSRNLKNALLLTTGMTAMGMADAVAQTPPPPPKDPNAPIERVKEESNNTDHDGPGGKYEFITPRMMSDIDRNILSHTWKKGGLGYTRTRNGLLNPFLSVDWETSRVMSLAFSEEKYKDMQETTLGSLAMNALNIGAHIKIVEDDPWGASFYSSFSSPWGQSNTYAAFSHFHSVTEFDFGVGAGFRLGPAVGRLEYNKVLGFFPGQQNVNITAFNYIRDEFRAKFKIGALMSNDREMGLYLDLTAGQETHNPFAWFDPFDLGSKQKQGWMFGATLGVQLGGLKAKDFKNIKIRGADDTSWNDEDFTGQDTYLLFKAPAVPDDELAEVKGLEEGATVIHFNAVPEMMHKARIQNMADMGIAVVEAPPITDLLGMEIKSNGNQIVVAQIPQLVDLDGNPFNQNGNSRLILAA